MNIALKETIEFKTRTGDLYIDTIGCLECEVYACVESCTLYGERLFSVKKQKPVLLLPPGKTGKLCTECLACEWACHSLGLGCLVINMPLKGLER